jgi:Ni2+-binding GTPase involved in maturation of urease and hydrogenase
MILHLVGGFLGSGKTTAIIAATRRLMAMGQRVGVVTNDQGRYLVDTAFFQAEHVPTVEVTGGCFCCHYDDLEERLEELDRSALPHVIFAESVGSCADLVATVIRPLLQLGNIETSRTTFSVFTDVRLLLRRLTGQPMPFSDQVVYIFDKQMEEAGLLVINKTDLVPEEEAHRVEQLAKARFPGKLLYRNSSLDGDGAVGWLAQIESDQHLLAVEPLSLDYTRYGAGERELAWFDGRVRLWSENPRQTVLSFVDAVAQALRAQNAAIGHMKIMVGGTKFSLVSADDTEWRQAVPELAAGEFEMLVNARAQTGAERLRDIVHAAIRKTGAECMDLEEESFHPGFPSPTHRIA